MSFWMLVLLASLLQNSEAYGENGRKLTIGEQLDIIIKDVSSYLYWLFGYGDNSSIESQIEESELLTEEFVKDVNDMLELMHAEAEIHIENVKNSKGKENENKTNFDEDRMKSDEKSDSSEEDTKEESAEKTSTKSKGKDDMEVIPLLNESQDY